MLRFDYVCSALACVTLCTMLLGLRQAAVAELRRKPSAWWCLGHVLFGISGTVGLLACRLDFGAAHPSPVAGLFHSPEPTSRDWLTPVAFLLASVGGFVALLDAGRIWVTRRAEREADRQALMGAAPPTGTNHEPSRVELS